MKHEYFKLVVVTIFDSPTLQNNSSFLFFLDSPASFLFDKLISFTIFFSRKIEYCYLNIYFMPFSIYRLSLKLKKKRKKKRIVCPYNLKKKKKYIYIYIYITYQRDWKPIFMNGIGLYITFFFFSFFFLKSNLRPQANSRWMPIKPRCIGLYPIMMMHKIISE